MLGDGMTPDTAASLSFVLDELDASAPDGGEPSGAEEGSHCERNTDINSQSDPIGGSSVRTHLARKFRRSGLRKVGRILARPRLARARD
jgi:hypothetical protein